MWKLKSKVQTRTVEGVGELTSYKYWVENIHDGAIIKKISASRECQYFSYEGVWAGVNFNFNFRSCIFDDINTSIEKNWIRFAEMFKNFNFLDRMKFEESVIFIKHIMGSIQEGLGYFPPINSLGSKPADQLHPTDPGHIKEVIFYVNNWEKKDEFASVDFGENVR